MALNLDIGFDINLCHERLVPQTKILTQLAFPAYIILLVIIVIVASECSAKFAKIIGKGNPVAVLATMILFSFYKFLNVILGSIYLLYFRPAYGSRQLDLTTIIGRGVPVLKQEGYLSIIYTSFLITVSILVIFLGILYTSIITFWQCFVQYQDKVLCKWMKYQKLRHFIEPYHAPYTPKYRYWTGLLLFACVVVSLISAVKFQFDPQIPVELLSTIVVIGGLLLVKRVTAKKVYKNWPLDVIELNNDLATSICLLFLPLHGIMYLHKL